MQVFASHRSTEQQPMMFWIPASFDNNVNQAEQVTDTCSRQEFICLAKQKALKLYYKMIMEHIHFTGPCSINKIWRR
jgi:hypothetical protein